jgi:hypothetical protein
MTVNRGQRHPLLPVFGSKRLARLFLGIQVPIARIPGLATQAPGRSMIASSRE